MNIKLAKFLTRITQFISPSLHYSLAYFRQRGRFPNLRNPKNITEIIGVQMLSGEINQYAEYADKVKVRDYLIEWGYEKYLPKLYGVWDSFEAIDFEILPEKFALKTNHGAGGNIICFDKKKLDINNAEKVITKSLNTSYGGKTETHYSLIKPKVFAEELLSDNGELPLDYKFHCYKGEIKGVLMVLERARGEGSKRLFYNNEWKKLNILKKKEANYEINKPGKLAEMIRLVEDIAKRFKHVRVDLYYVNNNIYIGELTFTPDGGFLRNFTLEGLHYLAEEPIKKT